MHVQKAVLLAIVFLIGFCDGQRGNTSELDDDKYLNYYENLIVHRIEEAQKYVPPSDASMYNGSGYTKRPLSNGIYDYIIVGAGSAGCLLANRLTVNPKNKVLLLEAGGYEDDFVDIPAMGFYTQSSLFNWGHKTIPQNSSCVGYINNSCPYPRGRGVGGTTLINGLVYARGAPDDYKRWAALSTADWSYENVLPFFKQHEQTRVFDVDQEFHGFNGELHVEQSTYNPPHVQAFIDGAIEIGAKNRDYNGKENIGVQRAQFNTENGRRYSAFDAFVKPIMSRKNLQISINSYVLKLVISPNKTVQGVEYMKYGKKYYAKAKQEVILSSGTIQSPQILMLSGIGPKKHLKSLDIKLVKELPVGDNFQDHATYLGLTFFTNTSIENLPLRGYIQQYLNGSGPFTLPANNAVVSYWNYNNGTEAELEIMMVSPNRTGKITTDNNLQFKPEIRAELNKNIDDITNQQSFTMYVFLLHPKSKGTIRLASSNPFDLPLIDANNLADPADKEVLYAGIQKALQIANTTSFRQLNITLQKVVMPGCDQYEYLSKDFWMCNMKYLSSHINHPVGTCAMSSVVDDELRVYGINRLRVADASVIPFSLAGHTNAPTSMVAEKLAYILNKSKPNESQ